MRRATTSRVLLCLSLGLSLAACDTVLRDPPPSKAKTEDNSARVSPPEIATVDDPPGFVDDPAELNVDPAIAAKAKALWDTGCASCHGAYGDGTGADGTLLNPAPRDFHQRAWQASAADEHIKKVILKGGGASGLSPAMVANLELQSQPEVLEQVIVLLRGFPHWQPAPPSSVAPPSTK
jgi:cytochrome c553